MGVTEQWFSNGDCRICRKNKYCDKNHKPCKPAQRRAAAEMTSALTSAMMKVVADSISCRPIE